MQLTREIDIPIVHGYAALVTNETDVVSFTSWRIQAGFCLTEEPPSSTILSLAESNCEDPQIAHYRLRSTLYFLTGMCLFAIQTCLYLLDKFGLGTL